MGIPIVYKYKYLGVMIDRNLNLKEHFLVALSLKGYLLVASNLKRAFRKSKQIISRAVSIPIFVKMEKNLPKKIKNAIKKAVL